MGVAKNIHVTGVQWFGLAEGSRPCLTYAYRTDLTPQAISEIILHRHVSKRIGHRQGLSAIIRNKYT